MTDSDVELAIIAIDDLINGDGITPGELRLIRRCLTVLRDERSD